MKNIVFIFVPTEANGKQTLREEVSSWIRACAGIDEPFADDKGEYPFWTWFLPNPLPPPEAREP